jgi:hypothetical protein
MVQVGTRLLQPNIVERRERGGVAELTGYRTECPNTTTCSSSDLLHAKGDSGVCRHEVFRPAHIGRNCAEPAASQPLQVIVWDAAKHQRHYQIGQGRQCDRFVGDSALPPDLARQEIDLTSQACSEPAGPIDARLEGETFSHMCTEQALQCMLQSRSFNP